MRNIYSKIVLGIVVLLIAFAISANAQVQPTGSGTEADPWQIATIDNLLWVSTNSSSWVNGTYFIQTANIDATDTQNWNGGQGFSPIGNNPTFFGGNYDGQNFGINGLYINRPTEYDQGLFGYSGGYIENVILTNVNITGFDGVGALVGYSYVTTVSNCTSSGYVTGIENRIGGLVGEIAGYLGSAFVTECISSANVTGLEHVGGLVGLNSHGIITYSSASGSVNGGNRTGGLVGTSAGSSSVTNCFSTGDVIGSSWVGGLIGSCSVTAVRNCYSRSSVSGVSYVAGLVGNLNESNVSDSYSTGSVVGTGSYVGGLVGDLYWFASCTNSFWDYETSGSTSSPGGGTAKTTAEMQDVATFTNETTAGLSYAWDFVGNPNGDTSNDDYWDIDGYNNAGYPYLSYQFTPPLQADFSASPTTISLGDNIHFTDLSTGSPTSWEWDFENDGTIDSYDQNPDWVYAASGIYNVSLRVSDGLYSVFSSKDDYIFVVDCNPTMVFSPDPLDFG
ncbi:MAG: PKD domain-containing protein, partial [Bacteroidales bacterium]|nr:PKD domain-containing protein [Bacteroidales bacterium]